MGTVFSNLMLHIELVIRLRQFMGGAQQRHRQEKGIPMPYPSLVCHNHVLGCLQVLPVLLGILSLLFYRLGNIHDKCFWEFES